MWSVAGRSHRGRRRFPRVGASHRPPVSLPPTASLLGLTRNPENITAGVGELGGGGLGVGGLGGGGLGVGGVSGVIVTCGVREGSSPTVAFTA